jgi:hypothetical protein
MLAFIQVHGKLFGRLWIQRLEIIETRKDLVVIADLTIGSIYPGIYGQGV